MRGNGEKSRTATPSESYWWDWLIFSMFREALPVWERYNGKVPAPELRKLERVGDWPRGLAAVVIKRLEDAEFRAQIRRLALEREAKRQKGR
jgi:hypothetical protein